MMLNTRLTKQPALRLEDRPLSGARTVQRRAAATPRSWGGRVSSLYVFSNSLTRFVLLFGSIPRQRLMGAYLIVIEQILLQFVLKRR